MTAADDFEALVRRELQQVATAAYNPSKAYVTRQMNQATARMVAAFEQFAGITADRRSILAAAASNGRYRDPTVHYQDDFQVPACDRTGRIRDPVTTLSRRHVNCSRCKRTSAYRDAS